MPQTKSSFSRVNRSESQAEEYYSRLSGFYDLLASSEKKFIKQGLILLDPKPEDKILEIGSGTGFAQLHLAGFVSKGFSVGLDLSEGMCQVAQKKLREVGYDNQAYLVRSNTLPIPFQSGVFDGVFTSFTLELFDSPQIPVVLREIQRVLKPGGRLVVVSLSKDQPLPLMGRLYERLHDRYPKLLDCRPIPVKTLVMSAGFRIDESRDMKMWGLPVIQILSKKSEDLPIYRHPT